MNLQLKYKEEVENVKCDDINEEEAEQYKELAEQMIEFAVQNGGMGLSAPQIGIHKKLIVWEGKEDTFHIGFNPSYYADGKDTNTVEGCLSYPDEQYFLTRKKSIRAVYYALNQGGKLVKITRKMINDEAIVFAHETDHINGITIAMIGKKL